MLRIYDLSVIVINMHKIRAANINQTIFKAYDIRGKYPDEINEDAAYRIARAFARYVALSNHEHKTLTIVIGTDARPSSPALKKAFIDGLLHEGANIIDGGLTTTPMHYFAVNYTRADGGAMITASHMPLPTNGFKLSRKGAVPIGSESGLAEIKNDALRGVFISPEREGRIEPHNFLGAYADFYEQKFSDLKESVVSFVADPSNGMAGLILPAVLERFSRWNVSYLHGEVDMTFQHHEADPLKTETMADVQEAVLKGRAAFGVSFDGDGDRIGFIDDNGDVVSTDAIAMLLAERYVREGDAAVFDVNVSRAVRETIESLGGRALEDRVGHSFIKARMKKERAVFGGEHSGHYYFKDFFYADSAIFALFSLIALLQEKRAEFSTLVKQLLRYHKSPEINFNVFDTDEALDGIAAHFHGERISYLDGIKIEHWDSFPPSEQWWFVLRPSNTENLLRLNIEAATEGLLEQKKKLIEELLRPFLL